MINIDEQEIYFKKAAKKNYSFYCEVVHDGKYIPAKHHFLLCNALERVTNGSLKKLMVFLPPTAWKKPNHNRNLPKLLFRPFPE